ncbi:MAG: U32 family peptidase [Clostridia bacterium]|nr:U32 family peptidase [Clostridia bacterium]
MLKTELLAPAGDPECIEAALRFGADAVYLGGEILQLRAQKAAFDRAGIRRASETVHAAGKKLYVTVNCFMRTDEIPALSEYGRFLHDAGVDAAIVSDIGAVDVLKKNVPDLPIHISTQANCRNAAAANVYYNMGAERVVLAREMSLDEIAELRAGTPKALELESFVHGAMCMAYSGRCLISSYMNGRSGNRGECTQPCRWNYYLVEQIRPGEYFEVEENGETSAILSSHDLNCIDFIDRIADAGVSSFKIEGRMKTAYYVATVVNAYRRRLDGSTELDALQKELSSVSHRPFSSGFYFGETVKNHFNDGAYRSDCLFAGVVVGKTDGGVLVQQRNRFRRGDELEVLSPDSFGASFRVGEMFSPEGEPIEDAKLVAQIVTVKTDMALSVGDFLRIRVKQA